MQNIISSVDLEILIRLILAMLCGMIIGTERILAHKTAGMRTYALVSLGAALFVVISEYMFMSMGSNSGGIDPFRMASAVVSGVGFLGAGIIFMKDNQITGITTASSIWVVAGIGIACGFGLFTLAIFATVITLFIFVVLWIVEQRLKKISLYDNQKKDY